MLVSKSPYLSFRCPYRPPTGQASQCDLLVLAPCFLLAEKPNSGTLRALVSIGSPQLLRMLLVCRQFRLLRIYS